MLLRRRRQQPTRKLLDAFLRDPHSLYAQLRRQAPAHCLELPDGVTGWVITRYDEARAALADPRLRKNLRLAAEFIPELSPLPPAEDELSEAFNRQLLTVDPPLHTRLRSLVDQALGSCRLPALRERLIPVADGLLDVALRPAHGSDLREPVDLLQEYSVPVSIAALADVFGIPDADRGVFRRSVSAIANEDGNESVEPRSGDAGWSELLDLLRRLLADKRAEPAGDLLTALCNLEAPDDQRKFEDVEILATACSALIPGHVNTVDLMGNGIHALLRHPDQLSLLRSRPSLLPSAIDEILRYESPYHLATLRFTVEPIRVGRVRIPSGEFVLVSLLSANRDSRRFKHPDRLDVFRYASDEPTGEHLAFGHGAHRCPGADLARLIGEVAIGRLVTRYSGVRLAAEPGELRWHGNTLVRGLQSLPVRLGS
ncbi:cytochrome P450 family protein [Flindersiella endophytica]